MILFTGKPKSKYEVKTDQRLLMEANDKIVLLETQAKEGVKQIETLKWMNAQLRCAITAVGRHYKLAPEAMKEIVDAYYAAQEAEINKLGKEAKAKFMADLKAGKVPEFVIGPGEEKKE